MSSNRKIKTEIITMLMDHVRIVYSVISDMSVYYSKWSKDFESNKKSLEKKKSKMQLAEEEADELKIQIIQNFSESGAFIGDYVALILRLDNLCNYPLEFVDMLDKIDLHDQKYEEIKNRYNKLINRIIEIADVLKTTIKNLRDNPDEVYKNTVSIHELENHIDKTYRQFLDYLYSTSEQDLNIRLLLRLRDSIVLLEQLADRIHDIADVIRLLLYQ